MTNYILWTKLGKYYVFTIEHIFDMYCYNNFILIAGRGGGNGREPAGRYPDRRSSQYTSPDDDIDRQRRQDDAAVVPVENGKSCDSEVPDHAGSVQR